MSRPADRDQVMKYAQGSELILLQASGELVTLTIDGGKVLRSRDGADPVVVLNAGPTVAASYLDRMAARAMSNKPASSGWLTRNGFVLHGGISLALVLAVICGIMVAGSDPFKPATGIVLGDGVTVEEANAARGPAPEVEVKTPPAQPQVELPTSVRVEPIPDVSAAGTSESALADRADQAAAAVANSQQDARDEVAASGTEKAANDLEEMRRALAVITAGDKITPEMALKLPHELAEQLRKAGAIQTTEEATLIAGGDDPQFTFVKIPPNVLDSYRDADGIPSIPEESTWAATGGNVMVPLPGGGDITTAEDFARFKLEP